MLWSIPTLSHHCSETTMSVVSLCNTDTESNHLLCIGSNVGSIDVVNLERRESVASYPGVHDNNVLGVDFYSDRVIYSYDNKSVIRTDFETSGRMNVFESYGTIYSMSNIYYEQPVVISTNHGVYSVDYRTNNSVLLQEADNVNEINVLYDNRTVFMVDNGSLYAFDIRNPQHKYNCNVSEPISKISSTESYIVLITKKRHVLSFDLPFNPLSFKDCMSFDKSILQRPAFYNDLICISDDLGSIMIIDPQGGDFDILNVPAQAPIMSISANNSEIAVAMEDDIYVFSHFKFEDCLIRPIQTLNEEESEPEELPGWISQSQNIQTEVGECSYEKYGYCDQLVYICRDCMREGQEPFGFCEQCAKVCHEGHDVHCIGMRRRFRCDCGNNKSKRPCRAMTEPKVAFNTRNTYGHNFYQRWCSCDGIDEGEMIQCYCCSDWFHIACIGLFPSNSTLKIEDIDDLSNYVFFCNHCISNRTTFLYDLPDGLVPESCREQITAAKTEYGISNSVSEGNGVGFKIKGGRMVPQELLSLFTNSPSYIEEFSVIDSREDDKNIPKATGQNEFANNMKQIYKELFQLVTQEGRTLVQASDVQKILGRFASSAINRRREED